MPTLGMFPETSERESASLDDICGKRKARMKEEADVSSEDGSGGINPTKSFRGEASLEGREPEPTLRCVALEMHVTCGKRGPLGH